MATAIANGKRTTTTDLTISRTVSGLLAVTGTPDRAFWEGIGISRTTFYEPAPRPAPRLIRMG